jgi:hypothetical protein
MCVAVVFIIFVKLAKPVENRCGFTKSAKVLVDIPSLFVIDAIIEEYFTTRGSMTFAQRFPQGFVLRDNIALWSREYHYALRQQILLRLIGAKRRQPSFGFLKFSEKPINVWTMTHGS